MEFNNISIEQFTKQGLQAATCFHNDLIVTNQLENVDQFKYPFRIDALTVLVCISGCLDCSINLRRYTIRANGILVNFPENILQIHDAGTVEAYAILISSDYLNALQLDSRLRSNAYIGIKENPLMYVPFEELSALKPYYELLTKNISMPYPENRETVRSLVLAFVHNILLLLHLFQEKRTEMEGEPVSRFQRLFDHFMSLLSEYHTSKRSVKFYAGKMCLTPNYLSGSVKEFSGKSAAAWINEYVILEAKTMLRFSDMSVQQVAYQLNFPTQSAFGKYFKQFTGISPKKYKITS